VSTSSLRYFAAALILVPILMQSSGPTPRVGTVAELSQLNSDERKTFYHLSEGSENFPLSWMKALISVKTNRPFMENMGRFGLIDDTNNLPIGITAEVTRDLGIFRNFKMVGVNCAACHTAEFRYHGKEFIVDGAPGKFDLTAYYEDLFGSAERLKLPLEFLQFLWRVSQNPSSDDYASTPIQLANMSRLTATIQSPQELQSDAYDAEFKKVLVMDLEAELVSFQEEQLDIRNNLVVAPESGPGTETTHFSLQGLDPEEIAKLSTMNVSSGIRPHDFDMLQSMKIDEGSKLLQLASSPTVRMAMMRSFAQSARDRYRLFLARLQFLAILAKSNREFTNAGFGRLDAFDNARNLLWPNSAIDATAPVSYPDLWTFTKTDYLHWDANTTSVIKRNIGQALGLGAVLDQKSYVSTVDPRHLHTLETLARKFTAPAWPEDIFGAINIEKFNRGAVLFKTNCSFCHAPDPPNEVLKTPADVKTDDQRVVNFAVYLNGKAFDVAINSLTTEVKNRAYKDSNVTPEEAKEFDGRQPKPDMPEWRTTNAYAARPLQGIWATAPYLHNNSVLNLWQLLLPADQRLKTFYPGCLEYDPEKVGFVSNKDCRPGQAPFEANKIGNSNAGHEYGTTLTESERKDLIEFLKAY
jgi:hypothetical protein